MPVHFFKRMIDSLTKTRTSLLGSLEQILPFGADLSDETLEEIEQVLFEADLGIHTADLVVSELRTRAGEIKRKETNPYQIIKRTILDILLQHTISTRIAIENGNPYVIFVVGVNGVGKTTTIGKLALRFKKDGYSVLLAACDTFRAAGVEQLEIWADRSQSECIKAPVGADAASVAYDAMMRAQARSTDIVIIDTAGRLHTSHNLMEELKKIRKVIKRAHAQAPQETLLVIDATTGQNALIQAETFNRELTVSGIALTKLDGTAKGGIVVSIIDKLGIPVKLIGIGEGIEDLRDFDPEMFAEAMFATNDIT